MHQEHTGQDIAQETPIAEWSTLEYEYRHKSTDWYWAVSIITLSFAVAAFILDGFFFAILIAVGGFVLLLYGAKRPGMLTCKIFARGIQIDHRLYPFTTLTSFGIDELDAPKLVIKSSRTFTPFIIVPLGDFPVESVRGALLPHLTEAEHQEPFSQKFMDRLGF